MALDNPSYFSITSGNDTTSSQQALSLDFTKSCVKMGGAASTMLGLDNISSSSECSLSRQLTPPRNAYQIKNSNGTQSLLRSVSSNSADSNQELLIMGEPRLSDIAPDLAFKYPSEPRRTNSLKSSKKSELLQCHDLMYFPLPMSEDAVASEEVSGDDEEVFISEDSARYYNFAVTSAGAVKDRRRHSISAFTIRERSTSTVSSSKSFKEDFPQDVIHSTAEKQSVRPSSSINIDDHSLRHGSYPRKRCNRCTKKPVAKRTDMDDILIISVKQSAAVTLWVDYFYSYFQHICKQANRKPFKIFHLGAEEVIETNIDIKLMQERAYGVKLQLIVVCPSLLEHISWNPTSASKLGRLIIPDRTLALLLGVSDDDLTDIHKNALSTYQQWQRLSVGLDQDENFTKSFLGTAVGILSRVWKQQTSVVPQQKSLFSVLPKKVRQGHSSVVIILTHPLQREDIVKVSIERNNEIMEVKSVKRRNPYTLKITIPECCTEVSAIVHILVEKNGSIIGSSPIKCESRLRELEQILRSSENPVEFMCQALGFSPANKEHMDNCLVYSFQKNMPPNFNLLFNTTHSSYASSIYTQKEGHEEYPTLLHFAARYGLEKLAMHLLDCPGGDIACDIRNSCDLTPAEMAQTAGHQELAHVLSGYMKMNEVKNVYEKLKEMSLQSKPINNDEDESGYLTPRQLENTYKICPTPKPFNPEQLPFPPCEQLPGTGYMAMNSCPLPTETNAEVTQLRSATKPLQISNKNSSKIALSLNLNTNHSQERLQHQQQTQQLTQPSPSTSQKNFEICEDKVQKELLEIINDFKNNVHSISQVEKLVEEWKNRNDVQKSFKEKQEQLNEMRLRYERIQQEIKNNTKKASPFERVKKLFFKGKAKEEIKIDIPTLTSSTLNTPTSSVSYTPTQSQRPISSLSLHSTSSSGSSGRMSTVSGCSMGDSGTHSDHEERKNILSNSVDEEFRNDLNKAIISLNYTVPPPPRPFNPVRATPRNKTFPTIEERPPQPIPRPIVSTSDMYYIEFPPSGLPVQDFDETKETNFSGTKCHSLDVITKEPQVNKEEIVQAYMNLPHSTIYPNQNKDLDSKEFHEYMNYKPQTTSVVK